VTSTGNFIRAGLLGSLSGRLE